MYSYTDFDRQFVHARAAQFRDQLQRHLAGQLGEEEFRPLRLQNGWYIQRHAPMLRIAVPYGELSSRQVRQLPQLPARQLAIRHRDAQHRRMALHVPAVLQAQRTELFFAELAGEVALQLIAKLRRACVHELAIEVGVGVHTVSSSL